MQLIRRIPSLLKVFKLGAANDRDVGSDRLQVWRIFRLEFKTIS